MINNAFNIDADKSTACKSECRAGIRMRLICDKIRLKRTKIRQKAGATEKEKSTKRGGLNPPLPPSEKGGI